MKTIYAILSIVAMLGCNGLLNNEKHYEVSHYVYTYTDDGLIDYILVYDSIGSGCRMQLDGIEKHRYFYDPNGTIQIDEYQIWSRIWNGNEKELSSRKWYNDDFWLWVSFMGNDTVSISEVRHDIAGNVIYSRSYGREFFSTWTQSVLSKMTHNESYYTYDAHNRIIRREFNDWAADTSTIDEYEYDENGILLSILSTSGGVVSKSRFEYHNVSDTLVVSRFVDGELVGIEKRMENDSLELSITYDVFMNPIVKNKTEFRRDSVIHTNIYFEDGLTTREILLFGKEILSEEKDSDYHSITKTEYNDKDDISRIVRITKE
jgi:hypothetical protein